MAVDHAQLWAILWGVRAIADPPPYLRRAKITREDFSDYGPNDDPAQIEDTPRRIIREDRAVCATADAVLEQLGEDPVVAV
jgi:hypothetical protein